MATDPLFIRLYLDEDFHPDLADLLRRQGVDCQSAADQRLGLRWSVGHPEQFGEVIQADRDFRVFGPKLASEIASARR